MKNIKLLALVISTIFSSNIYAELSCEQQGYEDVSNNIDASVDWNTVVASVSTNTLTDGLLTGIDAIAYQYGIKSWNNTYLTQWCSTHRPNSALANYGCRWADEPSTVFQTVAIIERYYCGPVAQRE